MDDPHNNILSQVCSQRARPIRTRPILSPPPLSLSISSPPPFPPYLLSNLSIVPRGCNARARVNRENERRNGGGREEGKRKNRPWQQIGITAHVTGCTVTVSVPFSNRIAASPRSRVLTIQQNRTFLLLSLSMFRDFSPPGIRFCSLFTTGKNGFVVFLLLRPYGCAYVYVCACGRSYIRGVLEHIESIIV